MKENRARLYEIAERQRGFFTTKQARSCGYVSPNHPYHVRTGEWVREHRGVYRLGRFPRTEDDELVLWALWSRGRDDQPQGVYSHQTALSLYDLSDVMPAKLHMTVPPDFRKTTTMPPILVVHKGLLSDKEVERREGYSVTTPIRAMEDLIRSGTEDRGQLRLALRQALERGLITPQQIDKSPLHKDLLGLRQERSR